MCARETADRRDVAPEMTFWSLVIDDRGEQRSKTPGKDASIGEGENTATP